MVRYRKDEQDGHQGQEDRAILTDEQIDALKKLTLHDGEFRVSLAKAIAADAACVEVLIQALLASMHEAVGRFAVKKVLQVGGTLLLVVLAWAIAKGWIQVRFD